MSDVIDRLDAIENRIMGGLKDFQRATVERVDWLYRHGQRRVLVSDEVGLGKTIIARGTVSKVAKLQREKGDELVKVVYICSNAAIAAQNLSKLRISRELRADSADSSRLSMQHLNIFNQESDPDLLSRYIQLIPLTPETSFRMTSGTGTCQERALMYAILRRVPELSRYRKQLEVAMMDWASSAWNDWARDYYECEVTECDKKTGGKYLAYMTDKIRDALTWEREDGSTCLDEVKELCRAIRRNGDQRVGGTAVIGKLRVHFARISLDKLEPDLVIMDEFQRFKFLLNADPESETGMLAHQFFHSKDVKMLLLSATPYKMYSTLEEIDENQVDEHYSEFLDVMRFLNEGMNHEEEFLTVWNDYSVRLKDLSRGDTTILQAKRAAEDAMYQTVCRTERCSTKDSADIIDDAGAKAALEVSEQDIRSYVQTQKLLDQIGANIRVPVDYVKSTPYLLSFMRDYQLKRHVERYFREHPDRLNLVNKDTLWVKRRTVDRYEKIPNGNARLDRVMGLALGQNAEKLLWVSPSRPYYEPDGAYKGANGFTKTLIFSSWEMVPRMLASLISYEAERKTVGAVAKAERGDDAHYFYTKEERRYPPPRMNFSLRQTGEPRAMALFCLLYPSRFLTDCYNPIACMNEGLSLRKIRKKLKTDIAEELKKYPAPKRGQEEQSWYYLAPLLLDGAEYATTWLYHGDEIAAMEEDAAPAKRESAFHVHLQTLRELYSEARSASAQNLGPRPDDLLDVLADMALASPAVCLNRTYQRYCGRNDSLSSDLPSQAARVFLNRMNTTESTAVVELVCGKKSDEAHWRNLLTYCRQGNLQAVFDEYAHLIVSGLEAYSPRVTELHRQLLEGLDFRTTQYTVDTLQEFKKRVQGQERKGKSLMNIRTHFAAAFTKGDGKEKDTDRKRKVRSAFNSPFRPFVLASTSIGQEGLDFHNYCRRIVHWNLPSNPIDLEQREGRINRFQCLAIRQNVAQRYGKGPFRENVWREMFAQAEQAERTEGSSDLIPYWGLRKTPDMVRIERVVPRYPYSRDGQNYERLIKILSLYRLTLGQARQEELLQYLFHNVEEEGFLREMFMNLSPYFKKDTP
ncbi:helicase-related protein [Desulfovibrio sp. ZJ200]|uniref:helicase-related protein n=1 Tax=Desulfovibrio sp. ZJ200 TaxID=2709792 RepID=UPI0013EA7B64|nr:helicase-related protein [Desulfovibrio sp. ZJ200]